MKTAIFHNMLMRERVNVSAGQNDAITAGELSLFDTV
jgi:hypothetical protein